MISCRDDLDLSQRQSYEISRKARQDRIKFDPGTDIVQAPEKFQVKFRTLKGNFTIEVSRAWAPKAADRFFNLTRAKFWRNCRLFRVIPGQLVQWGIHSDSRTTKRWREFSFDPDPAMKSNLKGYVCFGPDLETGKVSSQVIVHLADRTDWDALGYTPFGRVTSGLDVFGRVYGGYGDLDDLDGKGGFNAKRAAQRGLAYFERSFPFLTVIDSAKLLEDAK